MRPFLPLVLCFAFFAASAALAERVTVFAAASLKEALEELGAAFAEATGHEAVIALAGTAALARQIEAGAPADVFLSASAAWMDRLEADGLIEPARRIDLLGNRLVLIGHGPAGPAVALTQDTDLAAVLKGGRLAIALVEAVPAGVYGREALQSLGLWEQVADRLAEADNARAALALIALGAAPYGVVYATDAAAESRVHVAGVFPEDSHSPIVYPAAPVAGRLSAAAAAWLDFLQGDAARAAFQRRGFAVLAE